MKVFVMVFVYGGGEKILESTRMLKNRRPSKSLVYTAAGDAWLCEGVRS